MFQRTTLEDQTLRSTLPGISNLLCCIHEPVLGPHLGTIWRPWSTGQRGTLKSPSHCHSLPSHLTCFLAADQFSIGSGLGGLHSWTFSLEFSPYRPSCSQSWPIPAEEGTSTFSGAALILTSVVLFLETLWSIVSGLSWSTVPLPSMTPPPLVITLDLGHPCGPSLPVSTPPNFFTQVWNRDQAPCLFQTHHHFLSSAILLKFWIERWPNFVLTGC